MREPIAQALRRAAVAGLGRRARHRARAPRRGSARSALVGEILLERPEHDPRSASRLLPGRCRYRDHRDLSSDASRDSAARGIERGRGAGLMRDAVALAAAAREEFWSEPSNRADRLRPLIAASVGPYGAMLADGSEYRGRYAASDRELADFHGRGSRCSRAPAPISWPARLCRACARRSCWRGCSASSPA